MLKVGTNKNGANVLLSFTFSLFHFFTFSLLNALNDHQRNIVIRRCGFRKRGQR